MPKTPTHFFCLQQQVWLFEIALVWSEILYSTVGALEKSPRLLYFSCRHITVTLVQVFCFSGHITFASVENYYVISTSVHSILNQ